MATMMDNDRVVSDGTSSASESNSPELHATSPPRPAKRRPVADAAGKKRKTTYYARKDEIELLQDHVQSLQQKLIQYEQDAPPSIVPGLKNALLTNAVLLNAVQQSSLSLAGTQSLLSAQTLAMLHSTGGVPLKDTIHLPKDLAQRNAVLRAMHESKLRSALPFMTERTRFLDLSVAHKHSEQFALPDGHVATMSLDVTQFTGGHSLRQVYEGLLFFLRNQEMTISEQLGILTVRESDEPDEYQFCETRFLSTVPGGLEVESNIAMFTTYVDATDDAPAFAVAAMDFVDQDDLYPYRSETCARKELTGALTLHEIPSVTGGRPTIAMARWFYVRMVPPPFSISEAIGAASFDGMLNWCVAIPQIIQEQLSATVPAPTPI